MASGLQIHLHPMVLLTISDFITRHVLRRRELPIVGALLGQHNGREISLEYAFECEVIQSNEGIILHETWFKDRLQQYKDVHKAPPLELVGWFTTAPTSGPEPQHIPIHQQILHTYNETAILLAFHPSTVIEGASVGGKLPITIYESICESDKLGGHPADDGDKKMEVEGQETPLGLKFKELSYSVETGEAEMIGVDFVARGGGNATAVNGTTKKDTKTQGSQKTVGEKQVNGMNDSSALSPEDEELISSLTARVNAIKMLQERIRLLKTYLSNLPSSYLTTSDSPDPAASGPSSHKEINHPILRSIQALIRRLPLIMPSDHTLFEQESLAQKSDVSLVSLLSNLSEGAKDAKELGRKFAVVDQSRQSSKKSQGPMNDDFFGGGSGGQVMEKAGTGSFLMS